MNHVAKFTGLPEGVREFGFYVGGSWHAAGDRPQSVRSSPGHGVPVTRIALCDVADLDVAIEVARAAFRSRAWSGASGAERATILLAIASGIRARLDELAYWETLETGKPITQSRAEMADAAGHYEYAAGVSRTLHGDSFNNLGDDMFGVVTREPVGVVGVITPWNFPFIVLAERLPYILAAGNSVVIKPSELTSATTLILAEIVAESGLPAGIYNVVTGLGESIGQAMAEHPGIDMISFTGSSRVGEKVMVAAARNFKKVALELGGKNPQIVFADADLEDAADGVVFGLCHNAGQCCVSGSRLIVEEKIAERFEALLVEKFSRVRTGDCLDPATQFGAIVSDAHLQKILGYIRSGQEEGARLVCGGGELAIGNGRYVAPTLLADVKNSMQVARDEIFGPVLSLITFQDFDEALELANDSPYGLAASIWTKDIDKGIRAMRGVQAGRTWVNTTIAGGPEQAIGGFKQSGLGRETGVLGVEEYTEVKSVHIALGKRKHWVE
ncbi:aldehyde dehydrogenase family protein [Kaistia sp. MMO-174]|jgi:betaine-aldehyde dehydrogenase|uniref:aldehyde dehydrogenase family protein n=1 Tax=Kaistia sp. MMO-174 TaxID=3081256 RepID=UPI0030167D47